MIVLFYFRGTGFRGKAKFGKANMGKTNDGSCKIPNPGVMNPLNLLSIKDVEEVRQEERIEPMIERFPFSMPSFAKIFTLEQRQRVGSGDLAASLKDVGVGTILDLCKIGFPSLIRMTLMSFEMERLIKLSQQKIPKPTAEGEWLLMFKFGGTVIPDKFSGPIQEDEKPEIIQLKRMWQNKEATKHECEDFITYIMILSHVLQRVWTGISQLNVATNKQDNNPWIHCLENMNIQDIHVAPITIVSEKMTFGEVLNQIGINGNDIPHLLAAVATLIHFRSFVEMLPQSLVDMVMNKDVKDDTKITGCITMELTRNLTLLTKLPEFVMVGKNTSLFCKKTLSELEVQRRSLSWFKDSISDRTGLNYISKTSRELMENADRLIQVWALMAAVDAILSKFNDSMWVNLCYVNPHEYLRDKRSFDLKPMDTKCSLKIMGAMRQFCEDILGQGVMYRGPRSTAPFSICAGNPTIGKGGFPSVRVESTVCLQVLGHVMDRQDVMMEKIDKLCLAVEKQQTQMTQMMTGQQYPEPDADPLDDDENTADVDTYVQNVLDK